MKLHVFDAIVDDNHVRGFTRDRSGNKLKQQLRFKNLGITVLPHHWKYYDEMRTTDHPSSNYESIIKGIKDRGIAATVVPIKFFVFDWHLDIGNVRVYSKDRDLAEFRRFRNQLELSTE